METEDTQEYAKADAAAVKRKRRSSILKNQRPPRTPFSEVEFNVATPPDSTKSRRVSFSRRTGVAEFVKNEATTTWRNIYEEHNKSLESSGNENNLASNAPRQTIEHIGKRMFDQQFEEVEAVDLGGTIHTNPLQQFQASFNKINLTQELASLECMNDDLKFVPSQAKFEQSALTEFSKPFGNDMQCPVLEDMTNPLSMNFSAMQPMNSSKCDDLDEIQNDLERSKPSAMCPGPMNPGKDFSGYIEVADLDVTHGVIHNDGSEMSITDTIESPKVQDAAKISSVQQSKHKADDDWTNDKENMVFNPYVAPKESLTFAVNKVSDEVLVFDGKRLTTQSIASSISVNKDNFHQTLLPNASAHAPQRKTIILDVNDDLPNFIDNNSSKSHFNVHLSSMQSNNMAINEQNKTDTPVYDKSMANDTIDMCDTSNILSFTQVISSNIIASKKESLHIKHSNDIKDMSMTHTLKSNINLNSEKISAKHGKTIIFDDNTQNISITQALPTNINVNIASSDQHNLLNKSEKDATAAKRRTIIFDHESCDISFTQALPTNINLNKENEERNYNIFGDELTKSKSSEKRNTIIFDKETCDISMTQALPTNINLTENVERNNEIDKDFLNNKGSEKRRTIIFDKESCDISMTQALPTNINQLENIEKINEVNNKVAPCENSEKRRTIIFDKESCDISVTQALPTNINNIIDIIENKNEDNYKVAPDEKLQKRRTIIFDKDCCDISVTQTLPTNINILENIEKRNEDNYMVAFNENSEKRRTIIFDKESCDISVTQTLPININILENMEKRNEDTYKVASNQNSEKRRTIIFDKESCDISVTQALPTNINILENMEKRNEDTYKVASNQNSEKRRTIIFDKESCDISVTQALPTNINILENMEKRNEDTYKVASNQNSEKRRTIIFDKESCDISVTQALPTNINILENMEKINNMNNKIAPNDNSEKRRTIIFDKESCDISMTQAVPTDIHIIGNIESCNENNKIFVNEEHSEKRRTIIFGKDSCDISMTQVVPKSTDLIENLDQNNENNKKSLNDRKLEQQKTIIFEKDSCDVSVTQVISTNTNNEENLEKYCKYINESTEKSKTIFDTKSYDEAMKQSFSTDINLNAENIKRQSEISAKRKTIVFEDESCGITMPQALPSKVIANLLNSSETKENINTSQLASIQKQKNNTAFDNNQSKMDVEYYAEKNNIYNKKHSLVNKTSDDMDIQKDIWSHSNKGNKNKTLEENIPTSEYLPDKTGFTANVSVYLRNTNKQQNETNAENYNDEINEEIDVDKSVKIYKKETINDYLQKNNSKDQGHQQSRPKKSILDELLSMSSDSVKRDLSKYNVNDNIIHGTEIVKEDSILMSTTKEFNCKENFIDENKITHSGETPPVPVIGNNDSVILMENQSNENNLTDCSYKKSCAQVKNNAEKESEGKEDVTKVNMELDDSVKFITDLNSPNTFKSVKEADNTKDLLKMLSDITDEQDEKSTFMQENFMSKGECCEKPLVAEKNAIASKGTIQEPKRLSLAPRRQSIAISREDLLNNISMAKAALQQSRFEVDETEIMDDTSELIETHEINDTYKSNRMSNEVVKTLQFEDESASDSSIKTEIRNTPLRKSAVDEITSNNNKNVKVIPTFLTDVSVSLKGLMRDLVKPNVDAPFENNFTGINAPSTCNAEVGTDFIISSQIDVSQDVPTACLLKNSENIISKGETKNVGVEVDSVCLNGIKSSEMYSEVVDIQHSKTESSEVPIENNVKCNTTHSSPQKSKNKSIVFNSDNPLKNVLLPAIDYSDAHKYSQFGEGKGDGSTRRKSRQSSYKIKESGETNLGDRSFVNQDEKITEHMNIVCGESSSERSDASSSHANICKPMYADKSVESVVPSLKEAEVNTNIAMKENRDLIQSSSLTLVDESLTDSEFKMNTVTQPSIETLSEHGASSKTSPVKILFLNENDTKFTEKDSDVTLSEEIGNINLEAKTRKRSYSPTSTSTYVLSNVEVTPKPISKMQKMSNSPVVKSTNDKVDTDVMQVDLDEEEIMGAKNAEAQAKSPVHTEIVQKVDVQYNNYNKLKSKPIQISECRESEREKASENKDSLKQWSLSSEISQLDSNVITSRVVTSASSGVVTPIEEDKKDRTEMLYGPNVIESIKLLSFMGTSECEWECRGTEAWSFRLLCGRVRLRVRLQGGAVRADTPLAAVDVEIARTDEKDAIAGLCVELAAEAMRYEAAEAARADAVEALLRRCVRVARLARRWARAMRDAHARLAYHVLPDGHISLKVANLPLRRVVEARLHVSLAVRRERGVAYPCAERVTLAGAWPAGAGPADLARLADQPQDWGHVPRTIWKVFKYLKTRARTEDLLGN